jgi:hypothetical protein
VDGRRWTVDGGRGFGLGFEFETLDFDLGFDFSFGFDLVFPSSDEKSNLKPSQKFKNQDQIKI